MRPKNGRERKVPSALSLAAAIAVPLTLTSFIIFNFGAGKRYRTLPNKPFWFPPLWLIHLASFGSTFLMSLAACLVWLVGGFNADSDALPLYISQVALSIVWDPLVLVIGSARVGFVFCVVHFGTLVACHRRFEKLIPSAKDLVTPCLLWSGFLTVLTYKLIDKL
ncbi:hypothetical protein SLE2022_252950 [Rubroshorea leprosula]